jgi:PRTRC genetic system protein C
MAKRLFKYNDQQWEDPGEGFSNEDVRKHLSSFFPELAQASIEEKTLDDGTVEVRFVKRAGTKGARGKKVPIEDMLDPDVLAFYRRMGLSFGAIGEKVGASAFIVGEYARKVLPAELLGRQSKAQATAQDRPDACELHEARRAPAAAVARVEAAVAVRRELSPVLPDTPVETSAQGREAMLLAAIRHDLLAWQQALGAAQAEVERLLGDGRG